MLFSYVLLLEIVYYEFVNELVRETKNPCLSRRTAATSGNNTYSVYIKRHALNIGLSIVKNSTLYNLIAGNPMGTFILIFGS